MFTGLSSLRKLVITGFQQLKRIVSLPETLEFIDLGKNAIDVIEPDAFRLLNKLKHLNLERNYLTAERAIPAFAHSTHLEHLSLRMNIIDSLEGLKSVRLPRIRVLDLSYNNVTKLSKQTFATLPGLMNLNLGNNMIMEVETGAFDGLANLRVLSLANNYLRVFYFNVFESAANELGPPVNLLNLSLNGLSLNSVRWSSEMTMDVDESKLNAKEKKKLELDEAARLFAKCGFRNKLVVGLGSKKMQDRSFVDSIAARKLVRLSYSY
jgi:Leucine-rich repeat (LRR) protein